MKTNGKSTGHIPAYEKINSIYKYLICLSLGVLAYFLSRAVKMDELTHVMIGWDGFSLSAIIMSWITFSIVNSNQLQDVAGLQDQSRSFVFITVIISALASISAIILLIVSKEEGGLQSPLRIPLAAAGMFFSWFLIHTTFALRYAHIFYGDHPSKPESRAGGLDFPGDEDPDYMDFVYFSFVMGMTFQVSDVEIKSKHLRKLALFHSLISFFFSTIIIALTISILSSGN